MVCPSKGSGPIYRPRRPRRSPLYQIVERHFPQFEQAYDKSYAGRYGRWRPVVVFSMALGALYAAGIMRNHPFVDGNKRTGFLAAYAFLYVNGLEIVASEPEVIVQCLSLAANEINEAEFAAWLRDNVQPR